jgi:chromatin structure-remodeling complex subunit SFH1
LNKLYSDKFEWSLLHPPGHAEAFARVTCADIGLTGEWVLAITHAIYEAVLKLKKDACENGGLVGYGELDNDAAEGVEAGWRYEPERLAEDWEPKVEILSKEEIDRREGDRERQVRRQRRETARFSSTSNMISGMPSGDYFATPDNSEQPMGRGERSKKKRRFRSLSPSGRETPDTAAGYGGGGGLQEWYVIPLPSNLEYLLIQR